MRTILLSIAILSVHLLIAQVVPVKSDVYNWGDLKVDKSESLEKRHILKGSTKHFEYIEIEANTLDAKKSMPAYSNDDLEELIIVRSGTIRATVNGQSKMLGAGGVVLVTPGELRGFENAGKENVTWYTLRFKSKTTNDLARGKSAGGSSMVAWDEVKFEENPRGGRRQFFDRPTSTLTRLEMHTTKLNEGLNSHEPHTHPEEEVVLLLSGDAETQIGEEHTKVLPGGLIFLDSNVPHAITNIGKGPCEYFAFSMRPFNKTNQ